AGTAGRLDRHVAARDPAGSAAPGRGGTGRKPLFRTYRGSYLGHADSRRVVPPARPAVGSGHRVDGQRVDGGRRGVAVRARAQWKPVRGTSPAPTGTGRAASG